MPKKTIVIAIMTPKGGVGKSTLNNIVANDIRYLTCKNKKPAEIMLIDVDVQKSNRKLRLSDIEALQMQIASPEFKQLDKEMQTEIRSMKARYALLYKKIKWTPYDLKDVDTDNPDSIEKAIEIIQSNQLDYIFMDYPGSLAQEGTADILPYINYLFIPMDKSNYDVQTTVDFLRLIQAIKERDPQSLIGLKEVRCFFNKYETAAINKYDDIQQQIEESLGVSFLKTRVKKSAKVSSSAYNSILPIGININLNTGDITENPSLNFMQLSREILELTK